ncbi:acetyltransferase [Diplocarpon rosae]|nr:acetyltransferase [Diplocarpon rosae]
MGTPFINFLGPTDLHGYNRHAPATQQPDNIPKTFLDAMEVREQVFVEEQKVPIENEFDSDDHRACHWVIYASVNTVTDPEVKDSEGNLISRKKSVTRSTPIGTIRLVPFPHPPHPEPNSRYTADALETGSRMEKMKTEIGGDLGVWKGLVCVHAQKQVEKTWAKWGFKLDEEMGTWQEEGLEHVGMFTRLELQTRTGSG